MWTFAVCPDGGAANGGTPRAFDRDASSPIAAEAKGASVSFCDI
jgi:hypothetical protein